jgi:hypothetical protein
VPSTTAKLGLQKPLGSERVTREAYATNLDLIEQNAAREQFTIKTFSYDSDNNRIAITFGPGIVELFSGNTAALASKNNDTTYYIDTPAINTTYYLYLQAGGSFTHNTTGVVPDNSILLWTVATGAALSTLTTTDKRTILSNAGAKLVTQLAEYAQRIKRLQLGVTL